MEHDWFEIHRTAWNFQASAPIVVMQQRIIGNSALPMNLAMPPVQPTSSSSSMSSSAEVSFYDVLQMMKTLHKELILHRCSVNPNTASTFSIIDDLKGIIENALARERFRRDAAEQGGLNDQVVYEIDKVLKIRLESQSTVICEQMRKTLVDVVQVPPQDKRQASLRESLGSSDKDAIASAVADTLQKNGFQDDLWGALGRSKLKANSDVDVLAGTAAAANLQSEIKMIFENLVARNGSIEASLDRIGNSMSSVESHLSDLEGRVCALTNGQTLSRTYSNSMGKPKLAAPEENEARNLEAAPTSSNDLNSKHKKVWKHSVHVWDLGKRDDEETNWYHRTLDRKLQKAGGLQVALRAIGLGSVLPHECPDNMLVGLARSAWFHGLVGFAVFINVSFTVVATDRRAHQLLQAQPEKFPDWVRTVDDLFTLVFAIELAIRLAAFRLWFFIDPNHWRWNLFDLLIVSTSVFSVFITGVDLMAFRALRMLRVVRAASLVRLIRSVRELRKLLMAVIACIVPLVWSVLFIVLTTFLFSLTILQSITSEMGDVNERPEAAQIVHQLDMHFGGLGRCFKTLFIVVVGDEWVLPHEILSEMGSMYGVIMPLFVVFVNVGVMNIMIGVFAAATDRYHDHTIVAQDNIMHLEDFVTALLSIFREIAPVGHTSVDKEMCESFFRREEVQAYLAHQELDVGHAELIYDLCDQDDDGKVDLREFVLGIMMNKGSARRLDDKVIMHAIASIGQDLDSLREELKQAGPKRIQDL